MDDNAGPSGDATASPQLEATVSSINSNPNRSNAETREIPAEEMDVDPEPARASSPQISRQPSPPLPEFRRVNYPGHDFNSDEEEDEVLERLPIYITPALAPQLNLFQYPLHSKSIAPPQWAKDRGKLITARIKEKAEGRVEIEVPVDEGPDVWRGEKARDMGYTMIVHDNEDIEGGTWGRSQKDPKKKKVEKAPEKWGDKMRLRSENVPNATNYFSGVVYDGALHLHPVNKILQFRTSLQYVDDMKVDPDSAQAERNRMEASRIPKDVLKSGKPMEEEGDGNGTIKDLRTKLWKVEGREIDQPWVNYSWKDGDDAAVNEKLNALFVPEEKRHPLKCTSHGLDYLDNLNPEGSKP